MKKLLRILLCSWLCINFLQAEEQEVATRAAQWNAFGSDIFSYTITPSDLTCYPYKITKPGMYIVTRDFVHVAKAAQDGQPLIQVLSDNVVIHFQSFNIYQKKTQVDGTDDLVKSNLVEIGDATTSVCNVSLVNGSLVYPGGFGIRVFPGSSNIKFDNMKILKAAAGGIALAGNQNIKISNCEVTQAGVTDVAGDLSDLYFPDTVYDSISDDELGGVALLALDVEGLVVEHSSFSNNGTLTRDKNIYGIYLQNCADVTFDTVLSNLNKSNKTTIGCYMKGTSSFYMRNSKFTLNRGNDAVVGLKLKDVTQGGIEDTEISSNYAQGVIGLHLLSCNDIECKRMSIDNNHATGVYFTNELGAIVGTQVPFYAYNNVTEAWGATLGDVNLTAAYGVYKTKWALSEEAKSFVEWKELMDALHAIDYTMDYYTRGSKAYGVNMTNSSYITLEEIDVIGTYANHNSAFGVLIDLGKDNIVQHCNIQGTRAFAASTRPQDTIGTEIETLFGDILDDVSSDVKSNETISMIGRSVGLEIRNNSASNYVYKNQFKNNSSDYSFATGVFLNRSMKSTVMENRFESNCGSDFGYGITVRQVDPTDVVAGARFYANGHATDKNLSYGMHWSVSGKFSVKHVYPGDLDLANNIGPYENLQILFDRITIPSLDYVVPSPDVDSDYIV